MTTTTRINLSDYHGYGVTHTSNERRAPDGLTCHVVEYLLPSGFRTGRIQYRTLGFLVLRGGKPLVGSRDGLATREEVEMWLAGGGP